jgi:hypothetical protein
MLEQVEVVARRRWLSRHTIEAYGSWIRQFLAFCGKRQRVCWKPPAELRTEDGEAFLNDLVMRRRLSVSAQNPAMCALAFPYSHVLASVIPGRKRWMAPFPVWRVGLGASAPTALEDYALREMGFDSIHGARAMWIGWQVVDGFRIRSVA